MPFPNCPISVLELRLDNFYVTNICKLIQWNLYIKANVVAVVDRWLLYRGEEPYCTSIQDMKVWLLYTGGCFIQ